MEEKQRYREYVIATFNEHILKAGSGIFTTKTRRRIVGTLDMRGRGGRYGLEKKKNQPINDFWFDRRKQVKNALKDLELFIQVAEKDQIDQVLTKESLEPMINALLFGLAVWNVQAPDRNRGEMADMLIRLAFQYLKNTMSEDITLSHERTMKEATDLSNYLVSKIGGERIPIPRRIDDL